MPSRKKVQTPKISEWKEIVGRAIREDLGKGDLTSQLSLPQPIRACGFIISRENGVMAGGPIAKLTFQAVDHKLRVRLPIAEGKPFRKGEMILIVEGQAQSILAGERVALNFLQMLCAIASYTQKVVQQVKGTKAIVLATRKTTPGLRCLQKYAVQLGGGFPHRQGLYDEILIKENHLDMSGQKPELLARTIRRRVGKKIPITAEARNFQEALSWVRGGVDRLLLDNMSPSTLKKIIPQLRSEAKKLHFQIEFEASGGIRLANARAFAKAGVDRISLGSLTHSVHALDLGLDIVRQNQHSR